MNSETREQLWKDPDWTCPNCGFVNMAVRNKCRNFNCGWDWDRDGGEGVLVGMFEVAE